MCRMDRRTNCMQASCVRHVMLKNQTTLKWTCQVYIISLNGHCVWWFNNDGVYLLFLWSLYIQTLTSGRLKHSVGDHCFLLSLKGFTCSAQQSDFFFFFFFFLCHLINTTVMRRSGAVQWNSCPDCQVIIWSSSSLCVNVAAATECSCCDKAVQMYTLKPHPLFLVTVVCSISFLVHL